MLTITEQRNLYGELTTGTANVANLSFGERIIHAETRRLVAKMSDHLLHKTATASVTANQQEYELPNRVKKLRGVTFTLGSNTQYVRESPNRRHWDALNTGTATSYTSDFPEWYYLLGTKILYWPTPSSGSSVITYDYDVRYIDTTVADYTTGTVSVLTQGSTRIEGSSTSWSSAMVGRYFKADKSNTYANDGDGDYYEVGSVSNGTTIFLSKPYLGHSISGGSATYRIGEVAPLPDGFHEVPVYRAAEFYYSKSDQGRSQYFRQLASDLETDLMAANNATDLVAIEDTDETSSNPNLYPRDIG